MNSLTSNEEAEKSNKIMRESKLLEVLMAAKALSEIGCSDEEKSVPEPEQQIPAETTDTQMDVEESSSIPVVELDSAKEEYAKAENTEDDNDGPTTIKTFPEKLMDMLDHEDVTEAITWLPGGKSFSIINPKKFTDAVLPNFFKQAKFESFVRKLYRWGFRQVDKGEVGHITFYHKHFQKGNVALAVAKLRSVTPSKLSNAANKAAKERQAAEAAKLALSSGSSVVNDRPALPAATQSLLAQLRKERGMSFKSSLPLPMRELDVLPTNAAVRFPSDGHFPGSRGLGSSMATRILLKQQQIAAAAAMRPTMIHDPSASFLASHKLAQMHAAAAKMQKANIQSQMRMQAAAQWQVQLRQVLGNQAQLSRLGRSAGGDGLVKPMTPLGYQNKPALFSALPAAQPSYGQDIVKAAVDALNNAP